MVKEIPLTQGYVALVDDEDYDFLSIFKWQVLISKYTNTPYAKRHELSKKTGKKVVILMHRFIINATDGVKVDHRDGNGLNNTRSNLRLCTNIQNGRNRNPNKHSSSRYKGVGWHKRDKKWSAKIKVEGKEVWLGYHADEVEAAKAYNRAAVCYFGDYARLNQIPEEEIAA